MSKIFTLFLLAIASFANQSAFAQGNTLNFDGVDDYVEVPDDAAFAMTAAITVEAWVRTTSSTEQHITTKNGDAWVLAVNGNNGGSGLASFYLNGVSAAWLYGTTNVSDGKWHHIAATWDGALVSLYVDGALENSVAAAGSITTGVSPVLIGAGSGAFYLNGSVDELRIWDVARTATEVNTGRLNTVSPSATGLVAYYQFDETSGSTLSDATANVLTGTVNNTTNWVESYAMVIPTATPVTTITSNTQFTATWTAPLVGTVNNYRLEVSTSPTFSSFVSGFNGTTNLGTVTSTTVTVPSAGTYYYRVRADKTTVTGQGGYSNIITVATELTGTIIVGASQPIFKKLTDVKNALNARTVTGNVIFELDADYVGTTGETFPMVFNQFVTSGGSWTATIRPKAGVSSVTTSGTSTNESSIIRLNGADRLTFDGRAGGTGSTIAWTIRNSTASGVGGATVLLENDAQSNSFNYLTIEGMSQFTPAVTGTHGTIEFGTGSSTGNDNNSVTNCSIKDASATPAFGIYSNGNTSNSTTHNSNNTIAGNSISNFFHTVLPSSGPSSAGIYLAGGNSSWTISNNSFFQTASRTVTISGTVMAGIYVAGSGSSSMSISGNYIGGSAASASGTWAVSSNSSTNVNTVGVYLEEGTGHSVTGNFITNISLTIGGASANSDVFSGIYVGSNAVSDVTTNVIGSTLVTNALNFTLAGSLVKMNGINYSPANPTSVGNVTGNAVGGVTISGGSTANNTFYGIKALFTPSAITVNLNNNNIGSTTLTNSIRNTSTTMPATLIGIASQINTAALVNHNNNIVAGLTSAYTGSAVSNVFGINAQGTAPATINNNEIYELSSASINSGTLVDGIIINPAAASTGLMTIQGNSVHGIRLIGTGSANSASFGISLFAGSSSSIISKNKVYDLTSTLTGISGFKMSGIDLRSACTVANNLVSITNSSNTTNGEFRGIAAQLSVTPPGTSGTVNCYYNTVYIGGNNGTGNLNSYGIIRLQNTIGSNFKNNVIVNERSGSGGHYAVANLVSGGSGATAFASNNNFFITANASTVGYWAGTAKTLADWRTSSSGDAASVSYLTSDLAPSSVFTDKSTADLSITTNYRKYFAAHAAAGTGITDDYAGTTRNTSYPTLGAYEYPGSAPVWTGATSTDWFDATNWSSLAVPTADDNSIIATAANQPTIGSGTASSYSTTVTSGATLTIASGANLTLAENLINSGTLAGSAGALNMTGTRAQSVTGTIAIGDMTVNNSAGVSISSGSMVNLSGTLNVTLGTLTTNSGLTLKSTSIASTAQVAPVTGAITGNIIYERYMSLAANTSGRGWRLATSPLKGATGNNVYANWQNAGVANTVNGVDIWGPGGGTGIISAGNAFSIKKYNSTTNLWDNVTNTQTEPLFDANGNKAFVLFVTGPYGSGHINQYSGSESTILKSTGFLITGTQTYSVPAGGLQLVPNPYACAIDFDDVYGHNTSVINRQFWTVDPNKGDYGNYINVTWDINLGYVTNMATAQNQYIQSGQAFFVQAASGGNLDIFETDKETAQPNTAVFRTNNGDVETMRIVLKSAVVPTAPVDIDGALVICQQNYSNSVLPSEDGVKFSNFNESISVRNGTTKLSIEKRALYDNGDTVKFSMSAMKQQPYELEFVPGNFNAPGLIATIYDNYLNTSQLVSLGSNTTYSFSVDANAASYSNNRFVLVFSGATPLDVKFVDVAVVGKNDGAEVSWKMANEQGVSSYKLERSADGKSFAEIHSVTADGSGNYLSVDTKPFEGNNFYRVRAVSFRGNSIYSPVVRYNAGATAATLNAYPNPATSGSVLFNISGVEKGSYTISVLNPLGQVVSTKEYISSGGSGVVTINIDHLAAGVYHVRLQDMSGRQILEQKLLKQ
jgi:hypothetical protein